MAKDFYVGKVMTNDLITLGKQFLQRLVVIHHIPIRASFWLYLTEKEEWNLFIITPLVATEGAKKVYIKLLNILETDKQSGCTLPWDSLSITDEQDPYLSSLRMLPYSHQIVDQGISHTPVNGQYFEEAYIYRLYPGNWQDDSPPRLLTDSLVTKKHSLYQGQLTHLLWSLKQPVGVVFPACPIQTQDQIKVADVVWMSPDRYQQTKHEEICSVAPEVCIEIKLASSTPEELTNSQNLYFSAKAEEVWFCHDGAMNFFNSQGELSQSKLVPAFPVTISI